MDFLFVVLGMILVEGRIVLVPHSHNFQRSIQKYRSIPKQYLPPCFPNMHQQKKNVNSQCHSNNNIFSSSTLTEVITFNTVELELEESHLKNIVSHTEKHLSTLALPATDISHACIMSS